MKRYLFLYSVNNRQGVDFRFMHIKGESESEVIELFGKSRPSARIFPGYPKVSDKPLGAEVEALHEQIALKFS